MRDIEAISAVSGISDKNPYDLNHDPSQDPAMAGIVPPVAGITNNSLDSSANSSIDNSVTLSTNGSSIQSLQVCGGFQLDMTVDKMESLMKQLRDELFELLKVAEAHPKNLALWIEIIKIKADLKGLGKELTAAKNATPYDNSVAIIDMAASYDLQDSKISNHQHFNPINTKMELSSSSKISNSDSHAEILRSINATSTVV